VAEAMARHEFEGSRQGARARTAGADKDTKQGIELAGIVSESLIPPFASGFMVNDCGHLTQALYWYHTAVIMCLMGPS